MLLTFSLIVCAGAQERTPPWVSGSREKLCGLGTYYDALKLVFSSATAGRGTPLVTVQVLPSFQNEYAIVITRAASQIAVFRVRLHEQLWHRLTPASTNRTREECLTEATAASTDVTQLPIPSQTSERLWNEFVSTNLEMGACPHDKHGCVLFADGTGYVVQTADGKSLRLTEVGNGKKIQSENPALTAWLHSLLRAAEASKSE